MPESEKSQSGWAALALWVMLVVGADGYGSVSPVAASFDQGSEGGMFCAIDAGGKQQIICWVRNGTSAFTDEAFAPSMAVLSGGGGFVCGVLADDGRVLCWANNQTGTNLVPPKYQFRRYSQIASGERHACAVRNEMYGASPATGYVDCWAIQNSLPFSSPVIQAPRVIFEEVVAGNDFSCGLDRQGVAICWGSASLDFNVTAQSDRYFQSLASGSRHVCGIERYGFQVYCWGDNSMNQGNPPTDVEMIRLSAGRGHSCGIRRDNHGVECWGGFNQSSIPKAMAFLALASTDYVACGVREDTLLVDCWGNGTDYTPPLELCSPGLCSREACSSSRDFFFNTTSLGLQDLESLCLHKDEQICAPCAYSCWAGMFVSNPCSESADRVCSDCSLCQNGSCSALCPHGESQAEKDIAGGAKHKQHRLSLIAILGLSISAGSVIAFIGCLVPYMLLKRRGNWCFRRRKRDIEPSLGSANNIAHPSAQAATSSACSWSNSKAELPPMPMQAFRYTDLRDATNGFKELNELGRGSYGFVYKATLSDGRLVAVKRANAARRIQSNSRDFEAEIEVICKLHHANLVNLVGYCEEMGERLLVYEFMPHGTLHDHLHGGLSPLSWITRLRICAQACRGIEYLHKYASPPIIHKDIKPSNILLDADWGARVADFGLTVFGGDKTLQKGDSLSDSSYAHTNAYTDPDCFKSQTFTEKSDVYSFGVVLMEILSGRKAYDTDYKPPNIVEWAVPLIRQGKAKMILDHSIDPPRNMEVLLRMAEVAELCVRHDPEERPNISDVAARLDQLLRSTTTLPFT